MYDSIAGLFSSNGEWFWVMLQAIGVLVTLYVIGKQIRLQRYATMIGALGTLDARWKSQLMTSARVELCNAYDQVARDINKPEDLICSFFEELGLYTRKDILDVEAVWEIYSVHAEHYWLMMKPHIDKIRHDKRDRTYFSQFEWLYTHLSRYGKDNYNVETEINIPEFIIAEQQSVDCYRRWKEEDSSLRDERIAKIAFYRQQSVRRFSR